MLLRTRAWDIVREEYPVMKEANSLADAMRELNAVSDSGCLCALVMDDNGRLKGAVSMWDTVRFMEDNLLRGDALRGLDENRFEQMYTNACKVAGSTSVKDVMDKNPTVVAPDEPLLVVLEDFVKKGRSYAVVKEGPRVLGVIMIADIFKEISGQIVCRS
ncbi:CBS domain-containing protein [Desulfovibrio mangrovi]|uniref:CBS domain-containing protein n=1 Tax=Desulfovibrio mangrovi TaxID=2976983 RepID=UPI0022461FFF|nr:CBS domain-containing protein [Desulfovibrio mangrovi]UZP67284.1 CBS domain-containing protein [Desulfovibrio mangrovi]